MYPSMEFLLLCGVILALIYKWSTATFGALKGRGIPYDDPKPLIGGLDLNLFLGKTSFTKFLLRTYQKYENYKVYGTFLMRDHSITIRDPDLMRKIAIKDFDNFVNHKTAALSTSDNVLSNSLVGLKGHEWKDMRNTLTPTFTGSKMRLMFGLINECCEEAIKYVNNEMQKSGKDELDVELKDYFSRFANDVIATVAFGLKVDSFKDKENEFHKAGVKLTKLEILRLLKSFLIGLFPKVTKALNISIMPTDVVGYFKDLVFGAIKYRQEHNITRPDMIHLLIEAQRSHGSEQGKPSKLKFDDEALLAQCFIFFLAGFETVSTCLCCTLYELIKNPSAQEKLLEEIRHTDEQLKENGHESIDYDTLMKMNYLEMVLSESLRMWPPAGMTDRASEADYRLIDDDGNFVCDIKKGEQVIFPILAIQRDPQYFEEPEQFRPERFSQENKQNIKPFTYMPFGVGPRNCIGNRLALMETKLILYHIMRNFKATPNEKTVDDLMEAIKGFQTIPAEKFWTKLIKRQSSEA